MNRGRLARITGIFFTLMLVFTILSRAADQAGTAVVRVARPDKMMITHTVRASGRVSQNQELAVTTEPDQRVTSIEVSVGQRVKKGELLFTLDLGLLEEKILRQRQELQKQELVVKDAKSQEEVSEQQKANEQASAAEQYSLSTAQANTQLSHAKRQLQEAKQELSEYRKQAGLAQEDSAVEETLLQAVEQKTDAYLQAEQELVTLQWKIENEVNAALEGAKSGASITKNGMVHTQAAAETDGTAEIVEPLNDAEFADNQAGESATSGSNGAETRTLGGLTIEGIEVAGSAGGGVASGDNMSVGSAAGLGSSVGVEGSENDVILDGDAAPGSSMDGTGNGSISDNTGNAPEMPGSSSGTAFEVVGDSAGAASGTVGGGTGTASGMVGDGMGSMAGTIGDGTDNVSGDGADIVSGDGTDSVSGDGTDIVSGDGMDSISGGGSSGAAATPGGSASQAGGSASQAGGSASQPGGTSGMSTPTQAELDEVERSVRAGYQSELDRAKQKVNTTLTEKEKAEAALAQYQQERLASADQKSAETEKQLIANVQAAQEAYENAALSANAAAVTGGRAVQTAGIPNASNSSAEMNEIVYAQLQLELEKLETLKQDGGRVCAPADGLVTQINIRTGEKTTDTTALLMADLAKGYRFTAEITAEQEKYIGTGDEITLTDSKKREYEGLEVESVTEDEENEDVYHVSVQIPEDSLELGASATLEYSRKSEAYPVCVPLAALHLDAKNQPYVLVYDEHDSVLGTELRARKVSVTVQEQNESYAALAQGSITTQDSVIVGSDKAVDDGSRVRIES